MSFEPTKDLPEVNLNPNRRPAAVLLLIRARGEQNEPHLVFIRRTERVHTHKGQISFPGGGFKPEDGTLANTALRETYEELGFADGSLQILGPLPPVDTVVSNFLIYPFVGTLVDSKSEFFYKPDDFEVASVLEIPLRHLLNPAARRDEEWVLGGKPRPVVFYNYGQAVIWGATAFILHNFIAEINDGKWPMLLPAS